MVFDIDEFNDNLTGHFILDRIILFGSWCGVMFKVLHYYSDGPGIESRWCHWIFQ
jgi:hypothetical protein